MKDMIYRYMRYTEFRYMLVYNSLIFRYPGNWPDQLEALILRYMRSKEKVTELVKYCRKIHPEWSEGDLGTGIAVMLTLMLKTRCQCWTKKEDDLVLWNDRNCIDSVCVGVKSSVFDDYPYEENRLKHRNIIYKEKVDLEALFEQFSMYERKLSVPLSVKKEVFSYEDEHRLFLIPEDHGANYNAHGDTLEDFLIMHFNNIYDELGTEDEMAKFDINNIISVRTHPNSNKEFVKLVEHDCKMHGINNAFKGKSDLLD